MPLKFAKCSEECVPAPGCALLHPPLPQLWYLPNSSVRWFSSLIQQKIDQRKKEVGFRGLFVYFLLG